MGLVGRIQMKSYHYIVSGRVQGVAFRYYTAKAAKKHGIQGSVKNLFNGDVEVYAQGNDESIVQFEQFLNRGPISARVDRVTAEVGDPRQIFEGFEIIY